MVQRYAHASDGFELGTQIIFEVAQPAASIFLACRVINALQPSLEGALRRGLGIEKFTQLQ